MSDNVNCPFCDLWFDPTASHPPDPICPLSNYTLSVSQWNMRPPKKEAGHTPKPMQSEVEWLRLMVEKFVGELK